MATSTIDRKPVTYVDGRYKIASLKVGEQVKLRFTDLEHKDEVFEGEAVVASVTKDEVTFEEFLVDGRTSPTSARKDKWGQWMSSGLYTQVVGKAA